ncbi:hypothetical protein LXA43DRAFT_401040 [Ganoderma leucocontextum]|nr:hypothetical protein LXA43DRAFT_401040 [Ganoderma leucocontextum]
MHCGSVSYLLKSPNLLPPSRIVRPSFDNLSAPCSHLRHIHLLLIMIVAAFLPLRSPPYPYHRSPPDAFSPRVNFSPRLVLAPMSRVPRIQTSSRRDTDLPRDPSDWVDKDLLSYVQYNYSPVEAEPLFTVIERDRLTPRALWYLQTEPEQLLAIAEEESLRDTLLGLAFSLKPSVSPTTPRVRHVRRLSEDLERPPPPPPPPPPTPPTPEEPELEEDDDVAESIVSDWALDEDLDDDHSPTPAIDDLGGLVASAAQPEPPLEGLGLHTGEPHLDAATTPQPQPIPMGTEDLINLEDDPQPTVPQEEAPEPHATRTDIDATDDPPVEEPTSSQSASTDAHVPNVTEEKPAAATHHADPPAPPDEPSASRDVGAGMPADPGAGSNTFASPIEDDDLEIPSAAFETSPPPPPAADPARTATPTSDYHDANSTHGDEGERRETPPVEQEPEPSPVHPQRRDRPATSGDEEQSTAETSLPAEASLPVEIPDRRESGETTSSGDDARTCEEEQQENSVPAPSEEPVQTIPPATEPAQPPPATTDPAQFLPATTDPVPPPSEETTQVQEGHDSPATDPAREETAHVGSDDLKDTQSEEPPAQSASSGIPASEQSQETVEAEDRKSGDLGGEGAIGEVGEDEEATVSPNTTTELAETTAPPVATPDAVDKSPATEESSEGEASGTQGNDQPSATEALPVQAEAGVEDSSLPTRGENAPEKSSIPLEPPATENIPLPSLTTTTPTTTTTATGAFDAPPSPTVKLASGIEAQLVSLDPESTEQTPSASPSDTPPNASPSPSESRQASPPAETEAEKPLPPAGGVHIPSSQSSPSEATLNIVERKPPAPPPISTAFGSSSESLRSAAGPSANPRTGNPAWHHSSAFGSTSSPASAKTVGWGSAQSPAPKTPAWGRVINSMSSFFGSQSEPSTRDTSQEREGPVPRNPVSSPRQAPRAPANPWTQKKDRSALSPSSAAIQQLASKSSPPQQPAPAPISEQSSISNPAATSGSSSSDSSTPVAAPVQTEESAVTRKGTEDSGTLTDGVVVVDVGTINTGDGTTRATGDNEATSGQQPSTSESPVQNADGTGPKEEVGAAEDDSDLVEVSATDATEATETGAEKDDNGDDEDDNAPLQQWVNINIRAEQVRAAEADPQSSEPTSDAETRAERPKRLRKPQVRTTDLAAVAEALSSELNSPAAESPSPSTSAADKKRQKKARNKANRGGRRGGP